MQIMQDTGLATKLKVNISRGEYEEAGQLNRHTQLVTRNVLLRKFLWKKQKETGQYDVTVGLF